VGKSKRYGMAVFRLRVDPHLLLSRDDWPAREALFDDSMFRCWEWSKSRS